MKAVSTIRLGALLLLLSLSWAAGSRSDVSRTFDSPELTAFRANVGDHVTPVIVELRSPKAGRAAGQVAPRDAFTRQAETRLQQQDAFIASLPSRGIRLLPKKIDAVQADGSLQTVQYRFLQLLNGFSAYVADGDLDKLRRQPEVRAVHLTVPQGLHLDKAIEYSLGTQTTTAARRAAVYGATQELGPVGSAGHPETPADTAVDGFEGQGINLTVIDTGIEWRHPMFGGTGLNTPTPHMAGSPDAPGDNTRVIYYMNITPSTNAGDDFGHGTHVASDAAGYHVDGDTPAATGFGTGRDGTGIGPTINGEALQGTAPQARLMGYKVCHAGGTCEGTEIAIEDAASPETVLPSGPTGLAKPVADVINMSLGGGGSATSATAKISNNAALSGVIVVASAGNSGPGPSTVGSPCVGTLVICVAASRDPGSIAVGGVLDGPVPEQITGETSAGKTPDEGATAGPPEETGAASAANTAKAGARQTMSMFTAAGGGPLPGGSVSAHYVFADMRPTEGNAPPQTVTNRIALVRGTGAFANIANSVAPLMPAIILIITDVESATAVTVIGGIPTYTIGLDDANYLIDLMRTGDAGDGDDAVDVPHGTVSELPLRLSEAAALDAFVPAMASFSSRGPNSFVGSDYRTIKPDVTAPGSGITAATTASGNPDLALGMANPEGYVTVSGTSMSGPITAGAMALIRQRVRTELNLDTADTADPNYRTKRFDTVTVARALLQNNATNLRSGLGVPVADGAAAASINDLGAGHINVAGALQAKAIMVSPTLLLKDAEFDVPAINPPALDPNGNLEVLLPTASFANVPVVGLDGTVVKKRKVIIRDVTGGGGAGSYSLSFQDNRHATDPGFGISFLAADGVTPVTSVNVPSGGSAEFHVRVAADGRQLLVPGRQYQWFVTATQSSSGRTLRMPFYYRAVAPEVVGTAAPVQLDPSVETPAPDATSCATDSNGAYAVHFEYTPPEGGPAPAGFRVQEATRSDVVFLDAADEPLVAGANSLWAGSEQWSSSVNPSTGDPAYYIPDAADQDEVLTQVDALMLPAGSATLTFDSFESTEACCDFIHVELSEDDGASFSTLASFSGIFDGKRQFDLSPYAGKAIKLQFRMVSDLAVSDIGWYIGNITISSDDFQTMANLAPAAGTHAVSDKASGTFHYRVAGLFSTPDGNVAGPYSNTKCVTVELPNSLPVVDAGTGFTMDEGAQRSLAGTATDVDGDTLTIAWTQESGPAVSSFTGTDTLTPSFTAPQVDADTPLTFKLTVSDGRGDPVADTVQVTVHDLMGGTGGGPGIGNTSVGGALPPLTLLALGLLALRRRRLQH